MFKTLFEVILSLLLSTGTCDLIGFNRLGNNVKYHVQSKDLRTLLPPADYRVQYRKWILENHIAISDDNMWQQDFTTDDHSADQLTDRSTDQLTDQSVDHSIDQSSGHLVDNQWLIYTLLLQYIDVVFDVVNY